MNKNVLPALYAVSLIGGLSTIGVLTTLPPPQCSVEYKTTKEGYRVPVRVVGRSDYSGLPYFLALLTAFGSSAGYGMLLWKSIKGEELEESQPNTKVLTPGINSQVNMPVNIPTPEYEYAEVGQVPQNIPSSLNINLTKSEAPSEPVTRNIIQEIASSHQSTVIVAEPGCGKSMLERAVLATTIDTFPDTEIYIAGKKRDSWLGLSSMPGRFVRFSRESIDEFIDMIQSVQDELNRRLDTVESERDFNKKPLVLLLDDWHAIYSGLPTGKLRDEICQAIGEIITTGREVFVVAHIITQSFNVKSLGTDDANIRGSMNLIALMKSNTDENGRNDGGIGTASRMICNPSIVPDDATRQKLLGQLPRFIKRTEQTGLPAMVCLMGVSPSIEMLPDLSGVLEVKVFTMESEEKKETMTYQPTEVLDYESVPDISVDINTARELSLIHI